MQRHGLRCLAFLAAVPVSLAAAGYVLRRPSFGKTEEKSGSIGGRGGAALWTWLLERRLPFGNNSSSIHADAPPSPFSAGSNDSNKSSRPSSTESAVAKDAEREEEDAVAQLLTQLKSGYFDRIRSFSSPEKIFSVFATQPMGRARAMTIPDFLRALLPVVDFKGCPDLSPDQISVFAAFDSNGNGLIEYPEFAFFLSLLSIPRHQYRTAFLMFDKDEDGCLDPAEFADVIRAARKRSSAFVTALSQKVSSEDMFSRGVEQHFFGVDGKGCLSFERFAQFLDQVHQTLAQVEFQTLDKDRSGSISGSSFGALLASTARPLLKQKLLKHISAMPPVIRNVSISETDHLQFSRAMQMLPDILSALNAFEVVRGPIGQSEFTKAVRATARTAVSDDMLRVVFFVVGGGASTATEKELSDILGQRLFLGLNNQRDTGITRSLSCLAKCARQAQDAALDAADRLVR